MINAWIKQIGYVQLTIDLGRGEPHKILSNAPITYNQWHQVIVDRRGHYVTLTVKSEEGVGEISEDKVTWLLLHVVFICIILL